MFLCHPSETTKPLNFITAFLWELRSEETNPTWKDNVCHYPADEVRQRVGVSSDLRDTKRADLEPAQQVKRAPLTKEQEGKNTRKHRRDSVCPAGDLSILSQSRGEHTTTQCNHHHLQVSTVVSGSFSKQ